MLEGENLNEKENILQVKNLKKYFPITRGVFARVCGYLKAVDDVSFSVRRGETVGLVGESGSGKTTTAKTILRLTEPSDGEIVFDGVRITELEGAALRSLRRNMQVVFQDPYSSLNPRMTVGAIIREGLDIHRVGRRRERRERVHTLLREVGLDPSFENRYPHEFSGGQRQRVGIARARALEPKFIICDEPVSALDVSIRAQIINLLTDLQSRHNLSYLFISHDLGVVRYVSHRVAVMYLGKIVEEAPANELYRNPRHPYTRALLSAIPVADPRRRTKREILPGSVPSLFNLPTGCRFHPRCRFAEEICRRESPPERRISAEHTLLCHKDKPRTSVRG